MRTEFLAASLAAFLTQGLATAAPAPALLTPSGPWQVEYANTMCLLSRPFGPKQETRLILKPSMIGDKLEIIVRTVTTRIRGGQSGKVAMAVAGKPVADDMHFSAYSTAKSRLVRIGSSEEALTLPDLRDTLSIDANRESHHVFAITGIERARPVLNVCLDQLRTIYKVTKADLAPIVTQPMGTLPGLFSTADYPMEAMRKGESGTAGVLLWVETNGRVSTCQVIEPTASSILNQITCEILKRRARFRAAKNAAGSAIRAPTSARIRWILPG